MNTAATPGIQSDEIRASKMIGSAVHDVQNRKIGSVQDLVLDKNGKIDVVIIDVGSFLGIGGKNIAVPPSDIKTDNDRLTLDRTKEQLQQMAEYHLEDRTPQPAARPSRPREEDWARTARPLADP